MARPPIYDPSIDTKARTIGVKLGESEVERLVLLARAYGEPSPSHYVRKLLREHINAHRLEA
jgi:hypothetical protein